MLPVYICALTNHTHAQMLERIIQYSIHHKLIVFLFTFGVIGYGIYALFQIPIGAVPDITNNQVQIITSSRNLATEDVEKFITYPIELEMANLPEVKEIRSVSKFGLSVVTVVFHDNIGTFLPRQLIAEKIKSAEERIPESFGKPFMGPISTGLGEIYQYILDVEPEHAHKYSTTDLRTIQDWVVRRQLSGIPGVVEVNTWGGHLKQYEVAVDPAQLRAMHLSISQVYAAIEKNNSVAGGGYIEKVNETYFVRGEGLAASLQDIENIVVENRDGIPVYVKDIATVGFGHATRFGAITGNGEGEKVLGQVMMLKGADSKAVIEAVKERVAAIEPSLPEGVVINPFLERSELIGKTTFTIAENLILGCLIVIFVVVLLLGNMRSGLVVASIIPICLFFALSLMHIFGVDANLMSLGAIDFGIIIDGAVIIVEFIAYKITSHREQLAGLPVKEQRRLIDKITFQGTTKMMNSAVFGQLIIIIVFIPILTLVNVEGKMFRPMALVFCFALLGAMILCFTYVPVMASLFIRPSKNSKRNISVRLLAFLNKQYQPTITWALRRKKAVLSMAGALLVMVGLLFSQMGGEFVPTLNEGDFVIQPVLKTGTSLSKTIEMTTRMEKILKTFPEVDQVVSRIGAAEVPTDPMSMEESDIIIKLKPKSEWVSAKTKDELADRFKEALSEIPGIDYEFTQPIEMRFNELITGVRADLAIKVFGEDLDILYNKAIEIQNAIQNVEGAADIIVEKVAGLPQMSVIYDRQKIAKYGLNIAELNELVTMGFAGLTAGTIFEGEKQFDLVVRYNQANRLDIEHLETASIQLPNGSRLPLSELAQVTYTKGPAKISRDDTKRRVVIGVNVRNRDLESVVNEVSHIIESQVELPVGYNVTYGGQFENLRAAKSRLLIAVPIALILIFVLLYFAFNSVKEALLIYSAIPLATVGGVLLLYMRDMPFSISAGVGFIALFGIAVLNGIVLIEEFKELKAHGVHNINRRILVGTQKRLRPVLLTAAAAALGFLPMAISSSAGAEVQRPLATVVVGGLISATLLTLIVLPVLYAIFDRRTKGFSPKKAARLGMVLVLLTGGSLSARAQQEVTSLDQAVLLALEHNKALRSSEQRFQQQSQLVGTAFNPEKTRVYYNYDESARADNGQVLKVWGVEQALKFPTVYGAQRKVLKTEASLTKQQYEMDKQQLIKEVSKAYYDVLYWQEVNRKYAYLDSLFTHFEQAAQLRYEVGETNYLEKLTAETKQREIAILLEQSNESIQQAYVELNQWLQVEVSYHLTETLLPRVPLQTLDTVNHAGLRWYDQTRQLALNQVSLQKQQWLPDLTMEVFQASHSGANAPKYMGFQAGIAIPLWFGAPRAEVKAAKIGASMAQAAKENYHTQLEARYQSLRSDITKYEQALVYYDQNGKKLANELLVNAHMAFHEGEIDFLQYVQLIETAKNIELNHLNNLRQYNAAVLDANYLLN